MRTRSLLIKVLGFLLFAIGLSPWLSAAPAAASSDVTPYSQPIFSDFDGDNKLDQAELFSNGTQKRIHLTLGKSVWKSLSFDSGVLDRGHLVSRDIDSDGDADLIWVSQDYPKRFITWLGDGQGNFALEQESEQQLNTLKSLLWSDAEPRLTGDTDNPGLLCVLLTTSFAVFRSAPAYRCGFPAATQHFSAIRSGFVHTPFLSIIRKRGPPARIS